MENFAAETKELFVADILISLIDLCGGIVLLHRCWLIWDKNYLVIILPFLTAVGGFGEPHLYHSLRRNLIHLQLAG